MYNITLPSEARCPENTHWWGEDRLFLIHWKTFPLKLVGVCWQPLRGLLAGTSQIQNLFSVSDVTNSRVFEICRILVCNWHKPHFLSSLNGFSYFPLFLSTKTCYVPSINASGKWRNKLGQKLHILVIYTFLTQDTLLKRLLVGVLHWDWQVLIAGYLFKLWKTSSPNHRN